jgi:hypothetical protein
MSSAITISGPRWPFEVNYAPVTESSRQIQEISAEKQNYLQGSASDWFPTIDAALRNIRNECGRPDWDGNGANYVSDQTISLTEKITEMLFRLLSRGTPAPDVIPEADGEICISWSVDTDRLFSLSVGSHGKINFAGQFGTEGGIHGWQPVDTTSDDNFEKSLQDIVRQIGRL